MGLVSKSAGAPSATLHMPDRNMGLDTVSFFSDTVCKMAIKSDCAVRCLTAVSTLNELTGLNLSHQSVWRIVQNAGSWEQPMQKFLRRKQKQSAGPEPAKHRCRILQFGFEGG